jgi:L-gulonolactone oxidase
MARSSRTGTTGAAGAATGATWTNWGRTESANPARVVRPRDTAEVAAEVRAAVRDGLTVKAVGAGHSFTGAAVTDGVLVDTSALAGIRSVDALTGIAEVGAGSRLHDLSPLLWSNGLALASLGDIDRQAVAGAVSTGTHGTGLAWGGIAASVRALEIVLADGSVVRCSPSERAELFEAARVGLGAFGVVTALTLQCLPAFGIAATEAPMPLAQFVESADELAASHDHVEGFWFAHTDRVLALSKDHLPPGAPLRPLPRLRAVLDDELLANVALGAVSQIGARWPARIPALNRAVTALISARSFSDRSYRVFANQRRIRFREMEYAVPLATWRDVLTDIRRWLDVPGRHIGFPLELRFTGADDPWLSMSHGRPTAYISVQTHWRQPHAAFFGAVERIVAGYGGRPHWGKLHGLDAERLAPLYPRFADVVRVRDAVDPGRVFANAYTARVLGA